MQLKFTIKIQCMLIKNLNWLQLWQSEFRLCLSLNSRHFSQINLKSVHYREGPSIIIIHNVLLRINHFECKRYCLDRTSSMLGTGRILFMFVIPFVVFSLLCLLYVVGDIFYKSFKEQHSQITCMITVSIILINPIYFIFVIIWLSPTPFTSDSI